MHVECKNESDTIDGRQQFEPCQRHSENTRSTYRVRAISRNYIEQPYWAMHTYFWKCGYESSKHSAWEITLLAT